MRKIKKIASFVLALVMVFGMTVTAMAENTTAHTITITNTKGGHTYEAYQVFKGDISDGKLTNIEWGAGVKENELLTALKGMDNSPYTDCTSAEAVVAVLEKFKDNSEQLDAFAKVVGANLSSNVAGTSTEESSPYTIKVNGDGYYLVKDNNAVAGQDDAATKYILKVVEDVSVEAKADTPTIDKVIVNADSANGGDGKGTSQDVGSSVKFKLTSKVPEMDGYDSYQYVVKDTLSEGLTFNDDVKVTINETEYKDFTIAQNGQTFTITFNNFINQKSNAGKDIVITYSATINEKALKTDVEKNTVHLEYSNNPNDSASIGKTPDKVVYVYDFDIQIDKYESGNETKKLTGAMFVLKNNEGKYYHWNDTGKKVEWVSVANEPETTDKKAEEIKEAWEALGVTVATTDTSGVAKFQGLDSGNYNLKEIVAPAGFNLIKEDIPVEITASYNENGTLATSSATSTSNGQYSQTAKIENKGGTTLPSTGGMGTTIFYVLGGLLVAGAAVLLITKKRMNS